MGRLFEAYGFFGSYSFVLAHVTFYPAVAITARPDLSRTKVFQFVLKTFYTENYDIRKSFLNWAVTIVIHFHDKCLACLAEGRRSRTRNYKMNLANVFSMSDR